MSNSKIGNFVRQLCQGLIIGFVFMWGSVFAADTLAGQKFTPRSFPLTNVTSYTYRSKVMDRVYDISIAFPGDYADNPDTVYSALIVTDGNRMFPSAHAASEALSYDIRQPVIISIGAPFEEGEEAYKRRRVYEFSPPHWDMQDAFGSGIARSCKMVPKDCVGGASRFLEFMTLELLPDLYKLHRINPDDLGLFGLSAGGFFASWVIFQENSPFRKYIISSPAMAYGDGEVFREEAKYAGKNKDLPVSIYIASGILEMDDPSLEAVGKIVSGQARLAAVLRTRKYSSLTLYNEMHQGMGHVDVVPVTLARGLRLLYAKQ